MPSPAFRYSTVADIDALRAISEASATANPVAFVEATYNGIPAIYGFNATSTTTDNGDEYIEPNTGDGCWVKITGHNFIVNLDNFLSTGLSTDVLETNTVVYSNNYGSRFFRLDKSSTLPALGNIVVNANTGKLIALTGLTYVAPADTLPSSYNSNIPPLPGLLWITKATLPDRELAFVSRSALLGGWIPLNTNITDTSDPTFTPDYAGETLFNTSNFNFYAAAGTTDASDWKLIGTGT